MMLYSWNEILSQNCFIRMVMPRGLTAHAPKGLLSRKTTTPVRLGRKIVQLDLSDMVRFAHPVPRIGLSV